MSEGGQESLARRCWMIREETRTFKKKKNSGLLKGGPALACHACEQPTGGGMRHVWGTSKQAGNLTLLPHPDSSGFFDTMYVC